MTIYSLLFLLLSNAVTRKREKSILYSRQTILILLSSTYIATYYYDFSYLSEGIGIYGGLFHATAITQTFHIFMFIISSLILTLTAFYPKKTLANGYSSFYNNLLSRQSRKLADIKHTNILNNIYAEQADQEQFKIIEYPLIILFVIMGGTFLVSASDIVSIFLSIELQSYGLYLLCTLYRNSELSTSAGLTYFLLGGLSSCFILLGTSLLYANSGTTNLDGYYIIIGISSLANEYANSTLDWYKPLYLNISLLIMSVGFLFKISAAPFHFWSPDVYDAIPTIVTTFVAIIAKISILIFLLELLHYTSSYHFAFNFSWTSGLLFSSFLSLMIGAILGLTQSRIKRLLAYSTISHLGFILLALTINSLESIQAFIFYLMQYSITNLNAFLIVVTMGYYLYPFVNKGPSAAEYNKLSDIKYSPIQVISQLKGYFYLNPLLALSLAITLFSFVGVPPLIGFFAKQMVLSAALDSGFVFLTLIAILTSVISAVYYLNVIKQIFFFYHDYKLNPALLSMSTQDDTITNVKDNRNDITKNKTTEIEKEKEINEIENNEEKEIVNKRTNEILLIMCNLTLSSSLTLIISTLTLTLLFFMFLGKTIMNRACVMSVIMFNL